MNNEMDEILRNRGDVHGDFGEMARMYRELVLVYEHRRGNDHPNMPDALRTSLDFIFMKIARITTGDPLHEDHWRDVAGYALLALAEIRKSEPQDENNAEQLNLEGI